MKIILSRKGFDSSYGGVPSPIFRDENGVLNLYSLPIPSQNATCKYRDLYGNGYNLHELILSLRRRKTTSFLSTAHLDPDLVREVLPNRHPDWRPIFGQSGGQETQLENAGVSHSIDVNHRPLFLFFGWYREVEKFTDGYFFKKSAPNIHAFFGWLQVEQKIVLKNRRQVSVEYPWTAHHPHVACNDYDKVANAIYIAPKPGSKSDRLILGGYDTGLPASGMFRHFNPSIHQLTIDGQTRTIWRVPRWLYLNGKPKLGMHQKLNRWRKIPRQADSIELTSVARGQEFVLDSRHYNEQEVFKWVEQIVRSGHIEKPRTAKGTY